MAARSMWNGTLELGRLKLDVKLYAAVEDETVHFHLLHARDHERVKQHMVNPITSEIRETEDIHKAYEVQRGKFVRITDEELEELAPAPSKSIEISRFVPAAQIDPVWYERPYYLGPAKRSPEYFALAQVLRDEQLAGVAHWVMRKREYYGVLRAQGDYLALSTLHSLEEVAAAPRLEAAKREADARELKMAEQLVEALAGEFDPAAFRDEHRARVLELIAAKAKGKTIKKPARPRKRAPKGLGDALEQSLKALSKKPQNDRERQSA